MWQRCEPRASARAQAAPSLDIAVLSEPGRMIPSTTGATGSPAWGGGGSPAMRGDEPRGRIVDRAPARDEPRSSSVGPRRSVSAPRASWRRACRASRMGTVGVFATSDGVFNDDPGSWSGGLSRTSTRPGVAGGCGCAGHDNVRKRLLIQTGRRAPWAAELRRLDPSARPGARQDDAALANDLRPARVSHRPLISSRLSISRPKPES